MSPRDISGRILGRPLHSRYAPGGGSRRLRWLWILLAAWLLYAGVLSEHGFLRIAKLDGELKSAKRELRRVHDESGALGARLADPRERSEHAEGLLRAQGMARPGEIIYRLGGGRPDSTAKPRR